MKSKWIALNLAVLAACTVSVRAGVPSGTELFWSADAADSGTMQSTEVTSVDARSMGAWGFDLAGMDRSIKPGDDFEKFASGSWLKTTKIPDDKSRYGGFDMLRDLSDFRVLKLLQELGHTATTLPSEATEEQVDRVKLAELFSSYMDQAEIEQKDATPIAPALAAIKAISTPHDMAVFMGKSQGAFASGSTFFGAHVGSDEKNPDYNTLIVSQAGLGLPDREYYLKPIYAKQKDRYQQYVGQMLEMIGWEDPKGMAEKIVEMETKVAQAHWTCAENRDRDKTYNPMTVAAMVDFAPGFEWPAFLDAAGVGSVGKFVVAQNTAMPKIAAVFSSTPLKTLKAWQAFRVVDEASSVLSSRFVDASFEFHGKFMSGSPKQRDRVKRAASFCEGAMGEAIGREYVAKYFPPEAKAKADELVSDIRTAMRNRISKVEWMSPETKTRGAGEDG